MKVKSKWIVFALVIYLATFTLSATTKAFPENAFLAYVASLIFLSLTVLKTSPNTRKTLLIIFILSAGLAGIKLEGFVSCLIIGIGIAIFFPKAKYFKHVWMLPLVFSFPALMVIGGWFLWVSSAGYFSQSTHLSKSAFFSIDKTAVILKSLIRDFQRNHFFALAAGFTLTIFTVNRKKYTRRELFCFLVLVGHLIFVGLAIVGWEIPRIELYSYNATIRLFIHATPALIVFLASRVSRSSLAFELA